MADVNDLNQDNRVTKEEIDEIAGKKPGAGYSKAAPGTGFLGQAVNFAANANRALNPWWGLGAGAINDRARRDDWSTKRDALYKQYGVTSGAAPSGAPTTGIKAARRAGGQQPGALGGGAVDPGLANLEKTTFRDARYKPKKTGFETLGVNQGLIDAGIVREQMGPDGQIVYVTPRKGGESVVMMYKAQDAYTLMADWDDEQLGNFRRAMYISGYGNPRTWAGPLTMQDVDLMTEAMTDANMSGLGWDEVVNRRVEAGGRYARPLTMYEAAINAGDTASVLKQYGQRNGIVLSDSFIANQQRAVAEGQIDIEDLLGLIKETYVKTLYPAFAEEIDKGLTIEDLAGPWRSKIAETFGVKEEQISLFDPLLQAALQNFDPHGVPSKTKMNDFTEMVMQDPRWEYSPDAWNKIGMARDQLAATFGLDNTYAAPTVGYGGGAQGGGYRG